MFQLSEPGSKFVLKHEGYVSRAYRCPAKVLTIGSGFTMRSKTARKYWIETRGRPLKRGDTITKSENLKLLRLCANEYGKPAFRALPGAKLHQWEAGYSYTFNCGPGAAGDEWFTAFQRGDLKGAAARLRRSRCTARGKPLRGLRIRRGHEAELLEHGNYGAGIGMQSHGKVATRTKPNPEIREYQIKLASLGYNPGEADGWMGENTERAVLAFQKKHPDLVNDGIMGKATKVSIDRAIKAAQEGRKGGVAVVVGVGAGTAAAVTQAAQDDPGNVHYVLYAVAAAVVIGLAYSAWKFWPEIEHKIAEWKDA